MKNFVLILFSNATINTFYFVKKGHSFVCIGRAVKYVVRTFLNIITTKAKKNEAILKAMFKFDFVKLAQALT